MLGKIRRFYTETMQEFYKIVWPNRNELIITSTVVIVSVIFFSFLFLGVDYVVHYIIRVLLNIGKSL
jgi:preprotein translocase subunit SecE